MNYLLTAAVLKAFSFNSSTRSAYRLITRVRRPDKPVYHEHSTWVLDALSLIAPDHKPRLLEVGTGWVHAYSIYPALLTDAEIHCFDVSDIRYPLSHFQRTVARAAEQIGQRCEVSSVDLERMRRRVADVLAARTYDEAYRVLGIRYHLASDGLPDLAPNTIDLIYSIDVLEHVLASSFAACAARWFQILRPGGCFIAQVGLDDHLAHYDRNLGFSTKRYTHFSERTWKYWLANDVQYVNRLTAGEMLNILKKVGFTIEQDLREFDAAARDQVHPDYKWQSEEDLCAVRLTLRARKPE